MYSPSNRNSPPHHPRLHSFGALTTRYAHRRNRKAEQRSYFWDRTPEIHTENLNMKHFCQDFFLCCVRHPPPTPLLIPTGWQVDNERGASPHPQTQEPHTIIVPVAITFLLFHAFFLVSNTGEGASAGSPACPFHSRNSTTPRRRIPRIRLRDHNMVIIINN